MSETQLAVEQPKILVLDIETLPNQGYTWGRWDQNVIRFTQESCVATWVAKWLGDNKIISKALPDYPGYMPGSYDDRALIQDLWNLFNEADVIIAHNGDQFDIKVATGRFILHGLKPPSPFKTIDTKKMVKEVLVTIRIPSTTFVACLILGTRFIQTSTSGKVVSKVT